jgi:hypothetical protein
VVEEVVMVVKVEEALLVLLYDGDEHAFVNDVCEWLSYVVLQVLYHIFFEGFLQYLDLIFYFYSIFFLLVYLLCY